MALRLFPWLALVAFLAPSGLSPYVVRCLMPGVSRFATFVVPRGVFGPVRASRALPAFRVLHSCRVGICCQTHPFLPLGFRFDCLSRKTRGIADKISWPVAWTSTVCSASVVCPYSSLQRVQNLYPPGCWLFRDFPSRGAASPLPANFLPSVSTARRLCLSARVGLLESSRHPTFVWLRGNRCRPS